MRDRDREIENRLIKFVPLYQTVFLVMAVLVINAGDWHNMSKVTELPQVKINIMYIYLLLRDCSEFLVRGGGWSFS